MDASLCSLSPERFDDHDDSVRLQCLNEEDKSTGYQLPLLAGNQLRPIPQFTPSSPSPDMEAAIHHLSSNYNGNLDVRPNSLDEADVLMDDSFLEDVLNEPQEDASPLQASDARASYLAIVRSLYDIVGVEYPFDCGSPQHVPSAATVCCDGYVSSGDAPANKTDPAILLNGSTGNDLHKQTIKDGKQVCSTGNLIEGQGLQEGSTNQEVEEESTEAAVSSEGIRFEELNLGADYTSLYVPEKLHGTSDRSSRAAHQSRQGGQSKTSAAGKFIDVAGVLESCAEAVAVGDFRKANGIMYELYHVHGVSLQGNSLQRVAHYFCDALVARMAGMGGYQYRYMRQYLPPVVPVSKITKVWYRLIPYMKITHYFANQSILKVAQGSSRLHILDFGIMHGMQWPCLIKALADRKEGPPVLVITGIGNSPPCQESLQNIKETGQRLAAYARLHKVPFQFHAVVSNKWQDIDAASLQIQDGELLVVNTVLRLRNLADESPDLKSPVSSRQKFFTIMRSLNPHHLVAADISAACNSPFFVSRFREAFRLYEGLVDMLDTIAGGGDADWLFTEQRYYARDILNIVACEGADRVERSENYKQWDAHISRAGFELLSIPSVALSRSMSYVVHEYHRNFMVHKEGHGWMLLGWKGRPVIAMSAWRPLPDQ